MGPSNLADVMQDSGGMACKIIFAMPPSLLSVFNLEVSCSSFPCLPGASAMGSSPVSDLLDFFKPSLAVRPVVPDLVKFIC